MENRPGSAGNPSLIILVGKLKPFYNSIMFLTCVLGNLFPKEAECFFFFSKQHDTETVRPQATDIECGNFSSALGSWLFTIFLKYCEL